MVTAQGAGGDHPPREPEGFEEFLRSLRGPIAGMLDGVRPVTPVYLFARTESRRMACEDVTRWPAGLVAVGDAVCTFNPVYGQGMTVAAIEALLFREHHDFSADGCRRFQRAVAKAAAGSWLLSSNADQGWLGVRPGPAKRALGWYMRKWQVAATRDPDMFHRFLRVVHMLAGPVSLLSPAVWSRLRRWGGSATPDPRPERRPAAPNPR